MSIDGGLGCGFEDNFSQFSAMRDEQFALAVVPELEHLSLSDFILRGAQIGGCLRDVFLGVEAEERADGVPIAVDGDDRDDEGCVSGETVVVVGR